METRERAIEAIAKLIYGENAAELKLFIKEYGVAIRPPRTWDNLDDKARKYWKSKVPSLLSLTYPSGNPMIGLLDEDQTCPHPYQFPPISYTQAQRDMKGWQKVIPKEMDEQERVYLCEDCGKPRTKSEGGTVFTVCDECWDKHYGRRSPMTDKLTDELRLTEKEIKEVYREGNLVRDCFLSFKFEHALCDAQLAKLQPLLEQKDVRIAELEEQNRRFADRVAKHLDSIQGAKK